MVIEKHIELMCFSLENEQKTTPKIKKWSTQKWIDRFFRSHLVLVGYTASFCFLYYSTYNTLCNFFAVLIFLTTSSRHL